MMALIFLQSAQSKLPDTTHYFEYSDKVLHFLVFGVLGALIYRGFSKTITDRTSVLAYWTAVILGALFALSDEWHQSMVPGREADFWDWLADLFGILFFIYLYRYFQKRKLKTRT